MLPKAQRDARSKELSRGAGKRTSQRTAFRPTHREADRHIS